MDLAIKPFMNFVIIKEQLLLSQKLKILMKFSEGIIHTVGHLQMIMIVTNKALFFLWINII